MSAAVDLRYCWRGSNCGSYQLLMFTAISSRIQMSVTEIIRYYHKLPR